MLKRLKLCVEVLKRRKEKIIINRIAKTIISAFFIFITPAVIVAYLLES